MRFSFVPCLFLLLLCNNANSQSKQKQKPGAKNLGKSELYLQTGIQSKNLQDGLFENNNELELDLTYKKGYDHNTYWRIGLEDFRWATQIVNQGNDSVSYRLEERLRGIIGSVGLEQRFKANDSFSFFGSVLVRSSVGIADRSNIDNNPLVPTTSVGTNFYFDMDILIPFGLIYTFSEKWYFNMESIVRTKGGLVNTTFGVGYRFQWRKT